MTPDKGQEAVREHPAMPDVVAQQAWLEARIALLEEEKALTCARDALAAKRRRLPMVKVSKDYRFIGPEGEVRLRDLFEGKRHLIVYHFMFDPTWREGCPGCTGFVNDLGDLSPLAARDTAFVLVSRAPLEKLEAYKAENGWTLPWFSSHGGPFNYDFHVTLDEAVAPIMYNYRDKVTLERRGHATPKGEAHGLSVFFRDGDEVFHCYSTYARGCEGLTDSYSLLDVTPYGRQEDWEDSPEGWPQRPTYG